MRVQADLTALALVVCLHAGSRFASGAVPFFLPTPDATAVVILYAGLHRRGIRMILPALLSGWLQDIAAGGGPGLATLSCLLVSLAAGSLRRWLDLAERRHRVLAGGLAALAGGLMRAGLGLAILPGLPVLAAVGAAGSSALASALAAVPVFALLARADRQAAPPAGGLERA